MDVGLSTRILFLLIRRWKWLATGAGVATALAVVVLLLLPPVYVTTVSVVPVRARTEVNYDSRIRTLSSDSPTMEGQAALPAVAAERRQALAQLVRSAEIEQLVRERLQDQLPAGLAAPGQLIGMVQGKVAARSEIVTIEVRAPTPELSESVATNWSAIYEQQVNELYAPSTSGPPSLDKEVADARRQYEAAEAALAAFLASTPVEENSRTLESKQRLLSELLAIRQSQVADLHKIAHRVDLLIGQAEALRQQLTAAQDNSAAASSAAALTLLKTQAFASSMALPASLQVQIPPAQSSSPPPTSQQPNASSRSTTHAEPGPD
jgi:hypothetical protein